MFRHKGEDRSKKYIKSEDGNVLVLLNNSLDRVEKRSLTEREREVIKLISAHKDYLKSNQAKAMLLDEDYLKYYKFSRFFEKCPDFKSEYYKLLESTLVESQGKRVGLLDTQIEVFKRLVFVKTSDDCVIDPEEYVNKLSKKIIDNLKTASLVVWMNFARKLYKEVYEQKSVEFDKGAFTKPINRKGEKAINFFFSREIFKLNSIMSILFKDYNLKKDFIDGSYYSKKMIAEVLGEIRFLRLNRKFLACEDIDLIFKKNSMYLYDSNFRVSQDISKRLLEIPSIVYSNNRSIRGESNRDLARRYLEVTLASARYDKKGNLEGVGVFDFEDLKKLEKGQHDNRIKLKLVLNDSITTLICNKEIMRKDKNNNTVYEMVKPEWSLIALDIDCFIKIFEENADVKTLFSNGQLLNKFKFIYNSLAEYGFKDDNFKKITALI